MKAQFSLEFVLDVSFIIVIIAFLVLFFANFTNTNPTANAMNALCSQITQEIDLVSNSGGLSTVQYLNLLNTSSPQHYNISMSGGVVIIHVVSTSSKPLALVANTNTISCGADTLATANESFLLSNLAIFQNDSLVDLEYLSPNYTLIIGSSHSTSTYPVTIDGGGFAGNASFSLAYPNGTIEILHYETGPFAYNSSPLISALSAGNYVFSLTELSNPSISVTLPLAKS